MKSSTWGATPFFVALAHHFPNQLCGQAKSLTGIASIAYNQELNPNQGLTDLGKKVIDELLSITNGKRVYIDIKHMNMKSRQDFYAYLSTHYSDQDIPIISSHGATNFLPTPGHNTNEINFYNEDVLKVAISGGVFGIQLDARRLRKMKYGSKRRGLTADIERKGLYKRAFFVWRQIEVTALLVYKAKENNPALDHLDPWGFQIIGSDFDGIVDPLDGYWTHAEMPLLQEYLEKHAITFLKTTTAKNLSNYDQLDAKIIVQKFMFDNANTFLSKYLDR